MNTVSVIRHMYDLIRIQANLLDTGLNKASLPLHRRHDLHQSI